MPSTGILMRVTEAAWKELGVGAPDRALPGPSGPNPANPYVRLFWKKGQEANPGVVLHGIGQGLSRITVGSEPRAIVFHDEEGGVNWLCAGLSFPEGDRKHKKLYDEVERRLKNGILLPTQAEAEAGRAERFWYGVVDELAYALRQAQQQLNTWVHATVATTDGGSMQLARFFVDEVPVPGEAHYSLRYFIVLRELPDAIPHPSYWREVMFAELFPEGGTVDPIYTDDVPKGAGLTREEVIFVHELEVLDEDEALDEDES